MSKSLNEIINQIDRRNKIINLLIFIAGIIFTVVVFSVSPYEAPVPVTCQEQLRISEIKYKAVAVEVLNFLRNTIEEKRNARPDTLYILNTMSHPVDMKLSIVNGDSP